ncbi:MAG: hypothetical protein ACFE9C_06225 [Candidatus Hodarchaeota archaeon]
MNSKRVLKILLILGGIVEIVLGLLFLVLDLLFEHLGLENIPIFSQMGGIFILCYGILLMFSSRDLEKYLIIPLLNILARVIIIIFSLLNLFKYPQLFMILIFAIPYDLVWSSLMIVFMKQVGIIFKKISTRKEFN